MSRIVAMRLSLRDARLRSIPAFDHKRRGTRGEGKARRPQKRKAAESWRQRRSLAPRPSSLAPVLHYLMFGHCAPGSTSLNVDNVFTLPSFWTCPRYMVSGAWRCLFILITPRGPSNETSDNAAITLSASVDPAFSTASL